MSDAHKKAIKKGRQEAAAIKSYLDSLTTGARRRAADPKAIQRRLKALDSRLSAETNKLKRLDLTQQRMNLERSLDAASSEGDGSGLEKEFVAVASSYARRKGISYQAFRAAGVPAAVLKKAGISRSLR